MRHDFHARLAAVASLLVLPFVYGAAIPDTCDVGVGGGQYFFGFCGSELMRYGQGYGRCRFHKGEVASLAVEGGFSAEHVTEVDNEVPAVGKEGDRKPKVSVHTSESFWLRTVGRLDGTWFGAALGVAGHGRLRLGASRNTPTRS